MSRSRPKSLAKVVLITFFQVFPESMRAMPATGPTLTIANRQYSKSLTEPVLVRASKDAIWLRIGVDETLESFWEAHEFVMFLVIVSGRQTLVRGGSGCRASLIPGGSSFPVGLLTRETGNSQEIRRDHLDHPPLVPFPEES